MHLEAEEKTTYNCNALPIASKNSKLHSEWLKWSYKHVTVAQQHRSKVSLRKILKKKKRNQKTKNSKQNKKYPKTKKTCILGPKLHERISDPRLQTALKKLIKLSYSKG